jgi:ABC-2 type transport system ATP-binding protein
MLNDIDELRSFLQHGDNSLAIRRILDKSLDSGNEDLLHKSIELSRQYRQSQESATTNASTKFSLIANEVLDRLATDNSGFFKTQLLLDAEAVSKSYSKSSFTLQPISLRVSTGDIIGIVGENGNGKTTMLRCLAGQLAIDEGKLTYHQLNQPDHYSIQHHVAFIPQRIPRWHGMLKDNLHFSASLAGVTGKRNGVMVDFMLERLNLYPYAHLTWAQISSGYRTRFEIARILLQKPSLLILDEPLANLDINAQQIMLTDLRYLAKSLHHPMGIVLSSQQLHEVEKIADTVLFIKNGSCLYRTDVPAAVESSAIEVETIADRESLSEILGDEVQVQFNGGYYTLTSGQLNGGQMLGMLINAGIAITYFRDITHSTKRYF